MITKHHMVTDWTVAAFYILKTGEVWPGSKRGRELEPGKIKSQIGYRAQAPEKIGLAKLQRAVQLYPSSQDLGKDWSKEQLAQKKRESRRTWKPRRPPRVARTGTGCFAIIRLRAGRQPRIRGSGGLRIKWACFSSKSKTVFVFNIA